MVLVRCCSVEEARRLPPSPSLSSSLSRSAEWADLAIFRPRVSRVGCQCAETMLTPSASDFTSCLNATSGDMTGELSLLRCRVRALIFFDLPLLRQKPATTTSRPLSSARPLLPSTKRRLVDCNGYRFCWTKLGPRRELRSDLSGIQASSTTIQSSVLIRACRSGRNLKSTSIQSIQSLPNLDCAPCAS